MYIKLFNIFLYIKLTFFFCKYPNTRNLKTSHHSFKHDLKLNVTKCCCYFYPGLGYVITYFMSHLLGSAVSTATPL